MKYPTVLWDLDGTILNSSPGVFDCFRRTFQQIGLPSMTDEQMRPFMGPPLKTSFGSLGLNQAQVNECLEIYRDFYLNQGGAINAHLYPGVIETLELSKHQGRTLSLATSKAERGTKLVGEHFDFLKYFDVMGTASNDLTRHSKSEVLSCALDELQKLGADLTNPILIGDRIHDVEGAKEHGIEVVLVKWGFGTTEEWNQADHLVENAKELQQLLGLETN